MNQPTTVKQISAFPEIDRHDRRLGYSIVGLLFACYLFTYTGVIQSSDGLAMFATAHSMARQGSIDSNQLIWMGNQQGNFGPDGNLYSRKGLGMTVLAVPLVWAATLWSSIGLVQAALLLNPILTALTGGLLFRAARRLGWRRSTGVAIALLFGLGTLAWPYTQTFFSDPVCAFGLAGAAYGLLAHSQTARKRYLLLAGLAWSIAYLARVINLMTLPIFAFGLIAAIFAAAPVERPDRAPLPRPRSIGEGVRSLFVDHWRPVVAFALPVVLAGAFSLWWNWARYGSMWDSGYVETETFSAVWWFGLVGLLGGPGRGLIWYSPIVILALAGLGWWWRMRRLDLIFSAALILVYIGVYAKWYMWHGGYSWGPRFLVPILPFVALLIGPVWERSMARGSHALVRTGIVLLALLSVGVQWLGLLIPFGLVQEWLAVTVAPLFAPETFTQLRYSPLLLQWRFLSAENIHLAWWRANAAPDWVGLLLPSLAVLMAVVVLARNLRIAATTDDYSPLQTRTWPLTVTLAAVTLALLVYASTQLSHPELARAAQRISQSERGGDAVILLQPSQTQAFLDAYHGRLPVYGFQPSNTADVQADAWLARLRRDYRRVWVVPDPRAPEQSPWELGLRLNDFLLLDQRMREPNGQRLALYAVDQTQPLRETGLGTVFGDPALAESGISPANGWIRLDGYALTPEVRAGGDLLLALRWESLRPVAYDYQVFVHLLNPAEEKLAQRDGQPVLWLRPTSTWQPGEEIVDRYGMTLPNDLPAGAYTIAVGLYDPVNGQRLPVSAGPQDYAIELGPIVVQPPAR